jgi:hypothetical protein
MTLSLTRNEVVFFFRRCAQALDGVPTRLRSRAWGDSSNIGRAQGRLSANPNLQIPSASVLNVSASKTFALQYARHWPAFAVSLQPVIQSTIVCGALFLRLSWSAHRNDAVGRAISGYRINVPIMSANTSCGAFVLAVAGRRANGFGAWRYRTTPLRRNRAQRPGI